MKNIYQDRLQNEHIKKDESKRLLVLENYNILDSPPEKEFDDLVELAAYICKAPIALICFIAEDKQWVKAVKGLESSTINSHSKICQYAIDSPEILEIQDTVKNEKFLNHPLVISDPHIRFYAGVPLVSPEGYSLGVLCIMHTVAQRLDSAQKSALKTLAKEVVSHLELRKKKSELETAKVALEKLSRKRRITKVLNESEKRYKKLSKVAFEGIVMHDSGEIIETNAAFAKMVGYPYSQVNGMTLSTFFQGGYDASKSSTLPKELVAVRKDGTTFPAEILSKKVVYENGSITVTSVRDISERNALKSELVQSRIFQKAILESESFFVMTTDTAGIIRTFNTGAEKILGYSATELIGKVSISMFFGEEEIKARAKALSEEFNCKVEVNGFSVAVERAKRGLIDENEWTVIKKNGDEITVSVVGIALKSLEGEVIGFLGIGTDITEKKKVEQALARSERRFRSLVQNSTDMITVLEEDGIIRYQSPSFYRASGYTKEEVIGKYCPEFIHPDDISDSIAIFRKAKEKPGSSYNDEFRMRKANGEWMTIEISGKNALDDDAVKGIVINSRDVTERKRTEKEIKEKSKMLQGITSNLPVIVFKVDGNGFFTESVGAGLKKIGLEENEVVGGNIFELYPQMTDQIQKAYDGEPVTAILKSDDKSNPWYFEFYAFPDQENTDGGWIAFGLDISDKKIYDEMQKEHAQSLEKVNKELDQFAYVVSHDLKAPLRGINTLSEWIEEDLGEALDSYEEVKENMGLLRRRVNRMEALINGILEYSRAGRHEIIYEQVNMNDMIEDIMGTIDIPDSFSITKAAMPVITANKVRMEQVFTNLLSNAIKYHDKPTGKVIIDYKNAEGFHEFSVSDDGPGIDPEYHEKVFVIFQTLQSKDKTESTGVGLAIVKKIIEEQGGSIWITSKPGEGTKFSFTLPVKKGN